MIEILHQEIDQLKQERKTLQTTLDEARATMTESVTKKCINEEDSIINVMNNLAPLVSYNMFIKPLGV